MSVKAVNGGYVIDFTINNKRYRETIPAPHNKRALQRIEDQEKVYRMAISLDDKAIVSRFPNSKIVQKAFDIGCHYTIHDYSNIWFKQKQRNWSHTTIRGYTQKYNSYVKPNWGHLMLDQFKPSLFYEWASESLLSGKSINETRNVLNQIFKCAFFDEAIERNPIERVERFKQKQIEPNPFNRKEIKKILNRLSSPYKEYYSFAFFTGLRVGEILGIRWEDIDLKRKVAHIRVSITAGKEKEPKTPGSQRTVDLHNEAVNSLLRLKTSKITGPSRVFINPKDGSDYKNGDHLRKYIWKPALDLAGVTYRYPYQCRHTYASIMLSEGHNPMWVAKQMGHADWGMIRKVYGRWVSDT